MIKRAIREVAPDIIHLHWANPYPAAILLTMIPKRMKLVVHWHMDIVRTRFVYNLVKPIEKALLKRADAIVVTSPQYRESSIPLQPFLNKVKVVPNAMDESAFVLREGDQQQINAIKRKFGNVPIVFFVGRHIEYKGLFYLIEAEKLVRGNCVFVIAGKGPLTKKLEKSCHSERVHFIGRVSNDELRWLHNAADIFAFPSITRNEAFGVALAEAMYCFTPTVTFAIPGSGVNWVSLDGVTGLEVPNRDVGAFASAIDRLLNDHALSCQYAASAHQRVVDNFTIDRMNEKMNAVYNSL